MIALVVFAAVGFAAGTWLLVSTLWPAPTPLTAALERLHSPGSPRPLHVPTTVADRSPTVTVGRWLLRRVTTVGFGDEQTRSDLAVLHRPLEVHAGLTVTAAVAGAISGPLLWTVVAASGTRLPVLVPMWLSLAGIAVGAATPRLLLRAEAGKARGDFRHALGAYLDVLVLLLAAQEGPEGAMETAARAGNGPAFMEIRRATVAARLSGEPVWDALDALGRRVGVVELQEVAAAGSLAGERGAAVRRSLIAKARALRATSLAAAEANARRQSQAMFAPIVLMGIGFILFLLYPLVSNIQLGP
jgi:Flp pilus assembly protein TadB